MNEVSLPEPVRTTSSIRRVIIYAALLLVGFLFGFVPMWLKSRECSGSLSQAEHQVKHWQDRKRACIRGNRRAAGSL